MAVVVITGARGFLGRAVSSAFEFAGHKVVKVSRLPIENMVQVKDYGDVPDGDFIIHLAQDADRAQVNLYDENAISHVSHACFKLASRFKNKAIFASSATVYGDWNIKPAIETDDVFPLDTYSGLKIQNESVFLNKGGIVIRLANLFGSGMASNNVFSDILGQVKKDGPVVVKDRFPVRDFLEVSEAALGVLRVFENPQNGIFNLGSGEGISIENLAKKMLVAAGVNNKKIRSQSSEKKHSFLMLDIGKVSRECGWAPKESLSKNITNYVKSVGEC